MKLDFTGLGKPGCWKEWLRYPFRLVLVLTFLPLRLMGWRGRVSWNGLTLRHVSTKRRVFTVFKLIERPRYIGLIVSFSKVDDRKFGLAYALPLTPCFAINLKVVDRAVGSIDADPRRYYGVIIKEDGLRFLRGFQLGRKERMTDIPPTIRWR